MSGNLSLEERIVIQTMSSNGHSVPEISNYIHRNKTTVYREIYKAKGIDGAYDAHYAHKLASSNMIRARSRAVSAEAIKFIENKILTVQWSPDQISGWLKLEHGINVSHTWIYQYVDKDKASGGELFNHMRHGRYNKGHKEYNGKIPDRISIEERPELISQRVRLGDYEIDLIVGVKNQGAILSMIDRTSRHCFLKKLENKKAETVADSVIEGVRQLNYPVLTITSDNGTEFTNHKTISSALGLSYFFAHPYASYERGSIENLNGLVRQYIPKGTDFSQIDDLYVKGIQDKLNSRPRKILDYLTPDQYVDNIKARKLQLRV
jgi:IS30 family transposase